MGHFLHDSDQTASIIQENGIDRDDDRKVFLMGGIWEWDGRLQNVILSKCYLEHYGIKNGNPSRGDQMSEDDRMGAIWVPVTLTNSVDLGMVRRGVLNPKHLRSIEVKALVDTGAVMLVIPNSIALALGLEEQGQEVARYANGYEEVINISEPLKIECLGRSTTDEALIVGDEVLIGQVILEKLDFWADCKNQRLIPNPEHPDYPVMLLK
jgi:clan AA aspartic protease